MGPDTHLGWVAALAIALGISAAATTPAVGYATPTESGTSSADSSPTAGDSPTAGTSGSSEGRLPADSGAGPAKGVSAASSESAGSLSEPERHGHDAPTVTVRASGQEQTSPAAGETHQPDRDATIVADLQPTAGLDREPGDEMPAGPASAQITPTVVPDTASPDPASTPAVLPARRSSPVDPKDPMPSITTAAGRAQPAASQPGGTVADERLTTVTEPATTSAGSAVPLSAALVAHTPGPEPVTATATAGPASTAPPAPPRSTSTATDLPETVVDIASRLVTAVWGPLLAYGPHDPASPLPALWTMLAWARRELGQGLLDPAPTAGAQLPTAQPTGPLDLADPAPALTGPQTVGIDGIPLVGPVVGAVIGVVAHELSIYDFGTVSGWTAFLLDYTWGITGTALGGIVQVINTFTPNSDYDDDLSREIGSFVYDGGLIFFGGFITTMGNVTTNVGGFDYMMETHEEVHVWQSRVFGPAFQATYAAWLVGGAVVGTAVWLTDPSEDLFSLIQTAAYYDNPWEVWADAHYPGWPPYQGNPKLLWPASWVESIPWI